jgi:hypothetical protein
VALAAAVGAATLVALIVTFRRDAIDEGARYRPVVLIVPTDELPPVTPFTFQVTD